MKSRVKDKDVTAHLFEYTTTFGLDPELRFRYPDKGIVPTQIIFCLKEKNSKKINSHRWVLNAFGRVLQVSFPPRRSGKCWSFDMNELSSQMFASCWMLAHGLV